MKPRPSDCVFCGGVAGSKEHVWPAGLGGRRVNQTILCNDCNTQFSTLDAVLVDALAAINGLIGVRRDRDDKPRPAVADHGEGRIGIDGTGRPLLVEPIVGPELLGEDGRKHQVVAFSDSAQAERWIAEQRKAGRKISRDSQAERERFLAGPVVFRFQLGGYDMMREVARIAINYVALCFPQYARDPGLTGIKEFIVGSASQEAESWPARWANEEDLDFRHPDAPFAHQILLLIRSGSHCSYARVRLFGAFDFVISLGVLAADEAACVLFDVDPLADHPPNDIVKTTMEPNAFSEMRFRSESGADQDWTERLKASFSELMQRIFEGHWESACRPIVEQLNSDDNSLTEDDIVAILAPIRGYTLRALQLLSRMYESSDESVEAQYLRKMTAHDAHGPDGLSVNTTGVLQRALRLQARRLLVERDRGPVSMAAISEVMRGATAHQLILQALFVNHADEHPADVIR